jgi:hypothetical protein
MQIDVRPNLIWRRVFSAGVTAVQRVSGNASSICPLQAK